jgi:hypothetical protein
LERLLGLKSKSRKESEPHGYQGSAFQQRKQQVHDPWKMNGKKKEGREEGRKERRKEGGREKRKEDVEFCQCLFLRPLI